MVKPIKLYISVFIANSDCNGQSDNVEVIGRPTSLNDYD